jgi:hypothetical protein
MRQLRATAQSLRDGIDTVKGQYEDRLQEAERTARAHITHLQDMIKALRGELETRNGHRA